MYVESYQWQIGLERILILPLAACGFDTPYLSLPPLGIATMIPCTWGLSLAEGPSVAAEGKRNEGGRRGGGVRAAAATDNPQVQGIIVAIPKGGSDKYGVSNPQGAKGKINILSSPICH